MKHKIFPRFLICMLAAFFVVLGLGKTYAQSPQNATNSLTIGQQYYQAGRYHEAVLSLAEVANTSQQQGNDRLQSQSLNFLAMSYLELGQWEAAKKTLEEGLNLAQNNPKVRAQNFNIQGNYYLLTGHPEKALETWQKATQMYQEIGDSTGTLGTQINQAEALRQLGHLRRAENLLTRLQKSIETTRDPELKLKGLQSLGIALQSVGKYAQAKTILEQSLAQALQLNQKREISSSLYDLANVMQILGEKEQALEYYQEAAQTTDNSLTKVEAELNQLRLLDDLNQRSEALQLMPKIEQTLKQLSPTRYSLYAQVNFATSWLDVSDAESVVSDLEMAQMLAKAVQDAKKIQDQRAESLVQGTLGKLYEKNEQWEEAKSLTEKALFLAQKLQARDLTYVWQWQLSKILLELGDNPSAIAANQAAYDTLQSLRQDLISLPADVRFSFQEDIEPIYRNLVRLLLDNPSSQGNNLKAARDVIESLQLVELENFFRVACLNAKPEQVDTIIENEDTTAAVLYPIILPDRLAIIAKLPGQPLQQYNGTQENQEYIERTITRFRRSMNPALSNKQRLDLSKILYDWMIAPIDQQLQEQGIQTLVLVLDGVLRNAPIAALFDGEKYLVEKYAVALTPGLQLLEPRSLASVELQSLTGGLSESRQGFDPLPAVKTEIQQISQKFPSTVLLNETFTREAVEDQIKNTRSPIIHLATHGQFSSDLENTFLLTWDDKFLVNELSQVISDREWRQDTPIELLVLSACQTAQGDKRAALGLAGFAVRSGARSTLATLWPVNDQSTAEVMTDFYSQLLNSQVNRAQVLRQAQLNLLQNPNFRHPYYWAPFVLVGNWL